MKRVVFHFDPVSPYAYLAFERLPQALLGCSYVVEYRPLLFAGLLKHWGQLGPAEIAPKRDWTYRHVAWLAQRDGVALRMPAAHPFNPLPLLRLLLAHGLRSGQPGTANRFACEHVLRQVWGTGAAGDDVEALQSLAERLAGDEAQTLLADAQGDAVKALLRANTDAALASGVFGVPTCEVDGRLFWGADSLDMVAAGLRGDAAVDDAWDAAAGVVPGVTRAPR